MDDHWLPKFNLRGGEIHWEENSQLVPRSKLPGINQVIYTLNILQALFGLCNGTPPTVLKLGP